MSNEKRTNGASIAILGGGAAAKAIAADCALSGNQVNICDLPDFAKTTLENVERTGILLTGNQNNKYGFKRSGRAVLNKVTTDVKECVAGCKLVIVAVPSIAHDAFFEELVPVLEDGMIIHIIPDNFGSLKLRKKCVKAIVINPWLLAAGPVHPMAPEW